ncbi:MAG: nucleoside-triphosphatase [Candidatus Bathyarchaeia archaeon]
MFRRSRAVESIAIHALDYAENECDIVGIDEIGRMELFSKMFEQRGDKLLSGDRRILAVAHRNYIEKYKGKGVFIYSRRS